MQVRLFHGGSADAAAWEGFVARHVRATSDHCWAWRRILSESFGFTPYYLGAEERGQLAGILPLFRIPRGWNRWALSSIPFGNYGGICADSDEATGMLLESATHLLEETGSEYLELRHRAPVRGEGLIPQRLYVRFSLPITWDPEEHLERLGRGNRYKIARAIRLGLRSHVSRDLARLYPMHLHTFQRLGTPCFPRRYFELILEAFGPRAEIMYVLLDNRPIAFDLNLLFKRTIVCPFNGSLTPFLKYAPNLFLFWSQIKRACELGMVEVDACRSRIGSGPAEFKRRLRMVAEPLGYQYVVRNGHAVPQRNPSNPRYQLAIRLWQRLPMTLTRMLGPSVVRYLA